MLYRGISITDNRWTGIGRRHTRSLAEYLDEGVPVLVPTTYENEDGETVHADAGVVVKPGTTGFVRAFVDRLPSPFDCDPGVLTDLPVHDR